MAILAMDQVACLIADQLDGARLVRHRAEISPAHAAGTIPVLAPHGWMRSVDALPRTWDVTSDSIAAYIARDLEARELILLKPVDGELEELVDPAFESVRPAGLRVRAATPATLEALAAT
jgi:dihydroneopterin aldolase